MLGTRVNIDRTYFGLPGSAFHGFPRYLLHSTPCSPLLAQTKRDYVRPLGAVRGLLGASRPYGVPRLGSFGILASLSFCKCQLSFSWGTQVAQSRSYGYTFLGPQPRHCSYTWGTSKKVANTMAFRLWNVQVPPSLLIFSAAQVSVKGDSWG